MIYIYPKFSKYEFMGVRLGGAGLGNLLFMWSRAIIAAKEHNCEVLWPTWASIKVGPWIRHEADKRFYGDLFRNRTMIGGIKKYKALALNHKIYCKKYEQINWENVKDKDLIICTGFGLGPGELQMNFDGLHEYRDVLAETITGNLASKGKKALSFDADKSINVHVRLGDFSSNVQALDEGKNNTRIQISWYVATVNKIRDAAGYNIPVNVFSDGTDEELRDLLALPNVRRVTFGNSIGDIIGLSKAPLMIASGSSFSMWARFLGKCSSISYPNQMKDKALNEGEGFEIELSESESFSDDIIERIRKIMK